MLRLRQLTVLALLAGLLLGGPRLLAQDASADQAKTLLQQGISQYNAMDFLAAKETLLKVQADALSKDDQKLLADNLAKVDQAAKGQRQAMDQFEQGRAAIKEGDYQKARLCLLAAAESEYLPAQSRQDAKAELALAESKLKEATDLASAAPAAPAADQTVTVAPTVIVDDSTAVVITPEGTTTMPAPVEPAVVIETSQPTVQPTVQPAPQSDAERILAVVEGRQQRIRELIDQGKAHLEAKAPEKAAACFTQALEMDPNNPEAQRQLNFANEQMATVGEAGILTQMERERNIARQRAESRIETAIKLGQDELAKGNYGAAENQALIAGQELLTSRTYFSEQEYRQFQARIDSLRTAITTAQEAAEKARTRTAEIEAARAEAERIRQAEEQRRDAIKAALTRARQLTDEKKYEEAIAQYQAVLQLDKNNEEAIRMKQVLWDFYVVNRERTAKDKRVEQEQLQHIEIRETEIPWHTLINYPDDWREITRRRKGVDATTSGESEADRRVRARLQDTMERVDFTDTPLRDVIQFLREVSGLNLNVKWQALQGLGIDQTTQVTVQLSNISYRKALETTLDNVGGGVGQLGFIIDDGVITISTVDDLALKSVTRVYDIRDLIIVMPDFEAPDLDISDDNNDDDDDDDDDDDLLTRAEMVTQIIELIKATIQPISWEPTGTMSVRELNGQLVITQTRDAHEQIMDLFAQLREAASLQVSIEARFISISTGFLNEIGFDLDFVFNLGSRLQQDPATGQWFYGNQQYPGNPNGDSKFTVLPVNTDYSAASVIGASPISGISSTVTNSALSVGGTFLDDVQVNFLITATQFAGASRTLTAPRITLANGTSGSISVGERLAYVSNLEPVVSDNVLAYRPTIGVVGTGTELWVRPTVSADRRYVTLTLTPSVRTLQGFNKYFTSVTATDGEGNPLTGTGFIQLPQLVEQRIEASVSVPDRGTLLVGGQKLAGEVERESGVPLLNKVPIINRFFSQRGLARDEEILLILIKPTIIIQREEEERMFP